MIYYVSYSDSSVRKFSYDLQVDTYYYNYFTITKILRRFLHLSFVVRLWFWNTRGCLLVRKRLSTGRSDMCSDMLLSRNWVFFFISLGKTYQSQSRQHPDYKANLNTWQTSSISFSRLKSQRRVFWFHQWLTIKLNRPGQLEPIACPVNQTVFAFRRDALGIKAFRNREGPF